MDVESAFENVLSKLLNKQIDVATRLSEELFKIRLQKTLNLVILGDKDQFNNVLTKEEKYIFENVSKLIDKEQNVVIEPPSTDGFHPCLVTGGMFMKINDKIPKILGVDKKEYGPFSSQDMVLLPKENAEILIKRNVGQEIDLNGVEII